MSYTGRCKNCGSYTYGFGAKKIRRFKMNSKEIEHLSKMKFVKEVYPEPTQTAINKIDDRLNEVNRYYEQKMNELINTPYSDIEMDSLIFCYNAEINPLIKAKTELMIHSLPIRFYKEEDTL